MNDFMTSVWKTPGMTNVPSDFDANAASIQFATSDVTVGTDNLNGCTSLIVISRRGVYLTHYIEFPSFLETFSSLTDEDLAFIFGEGILSSIDTGNSLRTEYVPGSNAPKMIFSKAATTSLKSAADDAMFGADDHVKIMLVSPFKLNGYTELQYLDRLRLIIDRIKPFVPADAELFESGYRPLRNNPAYQDWWHSQRPSRESVEAFNNDYFSESADGKVLVNYSPGQGYKVWMFNNPQPVLQDQW